MMKKFLIITPGRTASTSLFNYIEHSLKSQYTDVAAIDRGWYSEEEIQKFNHAESAVFTVFNPYKFPHIVQKIQPSDWCLIVLTRKDFASWLLSMISIHATNNWHPGKGCILGSFSTSQHDLMSAYWYYKAWTNKIEDNADTHGFGKVSRIDFSELTTDWPAVGQLIGNWSWEVDETLMKKGMTTSWSSVENINDVLRWLPQDDIGLLNDIKKSRI